MKTMKTPLFVLVIFWSVIFSSCTAPENNKLSHSTRSNNPVRYNEGLVYSTEFFPGEDELFAYAEFRIYIPDGIKQLRGIIVHQHGCGRNGMSVPYDLHWQAFAKKWDFALLGTHYIANDSCSTWSNPSNGSEKAFFAALKTLGDLSGHPELETVPWCLWGHSGGGAWVLRMLSLYPERTIAVFGRSAGDTNITVPPDVPVCLNYGINDFRPEYYLKTYYHGRHAGGKWTLAIDSTTGHETGNSRLLSIPFFNACIAKRCNHDLKSDPGINDDDISGWLGDPETMLLVPENAYTGEKKDPTWLISREFADKWAEFITGGTVTDCTPPEFPPDNLQVEQSGNAARISFNLKADIESGVKSIFLLRDDTVVKEFVGPNDTYNRKFFQYGNFGDEPVPESLYENVELWIPPALEFIDYRLNKGNTLKYQVKFSNWSDLQSELSDPVYLKVK
jgi:hypothetical protein